MGSKFERLLDGEVYEINWKKYYLNFACCDCGMVHKIYFYPDGDLLFYKMIQNPRASAQLRRHKYGNLHKGKGKWEIKRKIK